MSWQTVVEGTVSAMGYELVEAERTPGGLLRVFIDRAVGDPRGEFIVVEDCEMVTRQLQRVLEVENCAYQRLEVSSPGLDRPLKKTADFVRFAGQLVNLTLKLPFKGRKRYRGTLVALPAASGHGWRLLLEPPEPAKAVAAPRGKANAAAAAGPSHALDEALDFELDEVREARLVPVLDFKGRRFQPAAQAGADEPAASGVDGGRDR